ncbi:MAG: hypothetical protein LBM01_02390 [Christensenellaceae bacterium]|nr:hypothetical protein [Christensenellaceae bacterium]
MAINEKLCTGIISRYEDAAFRELEEKLYEIEEAVDGEHIYPEDAPALKNKANEVYNGKLKRVNTLCFVCVAEPNEKEKNKNTKKCLINNLNR